MRSKKVSCGRCDRVCVPLEIEDEFYWGGEGDDTPDVLCFECVDDLLTMALRIEAASGRAQKRVLKLRKAA